MGRKAKQAVYFINGLMFCYLLTVASSAIALTKSKNKNLISETISVCGHFLCGGTQPISVKLRSLSKLVTDRLKKTSIETGLFFGALQSSRRGTLDTPFGVNKESNLENIGIAGAQFKVLFGHEDNAKPFLSVSGTNVFDSTNTLVKKKLLYVSQESKSKLSIDNDWLARLIFGIESKPFLKNFTAGAGIGGAIINQSLNSNITTLSEYNVHDSKTSLTPSALVSLTWLACPSCFAGHGGSISFQVAADQYPGLNADNKTMNGNPFNANVNQRWQVSEMLVFNFHL